MLNDQTTEAYKLAEHMAMMFKQGVHIDNIEKHFKANTEALPFWGKLAIVETFHYLKEVRH